MTDRDELALSGGNASQGVVRVADTVRKPWTPASESVFAYMQALADAGIDVPAPLGRDEQSRQITEFVPGALAMDSPALSREELSRVGSIVRSIHDASASFTPAEGAVWEPLIPPPSPELICHHDLAPWNLILGERWVFIDWDGAGPSTRAWDLAYAAQTFTLNDPEQQPAQAAARLAAFVAGYGADNTLRAQLPRAMARRTAAMLDLLKSSHREGREPWGTMFVEGHGEHWRAVSAYVEGHQALWTAALARGGEPLDDTTDGSANT